MLPLTLLAPLLAAVGGRAYLVNSQDYMSGALGAYPNVSYDTLPGPIFPIFNFDRQPDNLSPEKLLLAMRGPDVPLPGAVITDNTGELIWDGSAYGQTMAFSVQEYLGNPVLCLWVGQFNAAGYGQGNVLLLDQTYTVIANISTTIPGQFLDFHEARVTDNNTYLGTVFDVTPDLITGFIQEINITSGEALFTWNSSEHVNPDDCYAPNPNDGSPWDWIHLNSAQKDAKGNYLISSRHCHAVYYVAPSGDILWTLGGANSNFTGPGTDFSWQHDARWDGDGVDSLTLFDDAASTWTVSGPTARGMKIQLDWNNMTALDLAFDCPTSEVSSSQGSVHIQQTGNWIVGWGSESNFTTFFPNGTAIWTAQIGLGQTSYRALPGNWTGYPLTDPSINVTQGDNTTVKVSWSGATEVATWSLLADGQEVASTPKQFFEDQISVAASTLQGKQSIQVAALSGNGSTLGWSESYNLADNSTAQPTETRSIGTASFSPRPTETTEGGALNGGNGTSGASSSSASPTSKASSDKKIGAGKKEIGLAGVLGLVGLFGVSLLVTTV